MSEQLTRGLTRELILLKESEKAVIVEKSKLTILQLVVRNKKLTRVAIHELLVLLDKNVDSKTNTTIWNLLTSFEAGTVALELVTQFSTEKVNENSYTSEHS